MKYFQLNILVSIIDFKENCSFTMHYEVQLMHWFSYHVTIFVHLTCRHNPKVDQIGDESKILIEHYLCVSNDRRHDSYFVQHCLLLH